MAENTFRLQGPENTIKHVQVHPVNMEALRDTFGS
jgi:hypothetical protein